MRLHLLMTISGNLSQESPNGQLSMPDSILDDISHRRYNPLRGTWILVSPHRTKRPWQSVTKDSSQVGIGIADDRGNF